MSKQFSLPKKNDPLSAVLRADARYGRILFFSLHPPLAEYVHSSIEIFLFDAATHK